MFVIIEHKPILMAKVQARLHSQCIICGSEHPRGLRLTFSTQADGRVEAHFSCEQIYQGYAGYLHGGVIAALLDSAMTNCLFAQGQVALTGELNVRFLKPVMVDRHAVVRAWMERSLAHLFKMRADFHQDSCLMARATAKFMEVEKQDYPSIAGKVAE